MGYNESRVVGSRVSTRQDLIDLIEAVKAGKVRPLVSRVCPWEVVNKVLAAVGEGASPGRIVLRY